MRHPDAIVLDREALGILVDGNPNHERIRCEGRIFQRLIAQLLASVGGVGQKFTQKNVAVGIDRMHHEMQQFGDIRLKCLRLRSLTVIPYPRHTRASFRCPTASRIWRCCRWSSARHHPFAARILPLRPPDARASKRVLRFSDVAIARNPTNLPPRLSQICQKNACSPASFKRRWCSG